MKLLVAIVMLAIVQTAPPVPRKTADDAAGTRHEVKTQTQAQQRPAALAQGAPQTNATQELPPVSVTKDWWDRFYVIFTGALVVVGGLGVFFAIKTLRTIERQARSMRYQTTHLKNAVVAAREQAKAAKTSADAALLNAQAVLNSERAWLFTEINRGEMLDGSGINMVVKNSGRTPARVLAIRHNSIIIPSTGELPETPDYGPAAQFETVVVLLPEGHLSVEQIELNPIMWRSIDPGIDDGPKRVFVYGIVEYRDVFSGSSIHETRFCYRYFRQYQEWRTAGPEEYTKYS
jgi:hypothetical protein